MVKKINEINIQMRRVFRYDFAIGAKSLKNLIPLGSRVILNIVKNFTEGPFGRYNFRLKKLLLIFAIITALTELLSYKFFITFNQSNSLPGKLYVVIRDHHITRGDIVVAQLHDDPFYKNETILKQVTGIAGDKIVKEGREFYINNQLIAKAKTHSKQGEQLAVTELETSVIPYQNYFLTTNHKDSYDSRYDYVGFISESDIRGTAYRVF